MKEFKTFFVMIVFVFTVVVASVTAFSWPGWDIKIGSILMKISLKNFLYEITNNLDDLPTYDFVVVGSGSAGSSLVAELLDKKPDLKILLLDAGTHKILPFVYKYENSFVLPLTSYVWKDESSPEYFLRNRTVDLLAGRGIGGSSLINFMFWVRGHPNDYNSWALKVKDDTWNYTNLIPLFKKLETFNDASSIYRGDAGPVTNKISNTTVSNNFVDSFKELGYKIDVDYNAENAYGASIAQMNVKMPDKYDDSAKRQDSFSTQLTKHLNFDSNLDVLTNAYAEKVVLNDKKQVEYLIFKYDGITYKVRAKKEVIISCGTIRSPNFLFQSGIGNCSHLKSKGIECKHNLPGVGKNLQYHMITFLMWKFRNKFIPDGDILNIVFDGQWNLTSLPTPKHVIEPFYNRKLPLLGPSSFGMIYIQSHHRSRGQITVRSTNPKDPPIVQLNAFSHPQDIADHLEGIRLALKLGKKIGEKYPSDQFLPSDKKTSDNELFRFVQNTVVSYHQTGTCKMGDTLDEDAVVDSKLKVKGIEGLRIADLSIAPDVPTGNTNAAANVIGAKCAQFILNEYYP